MTQRKIVRGEYTVPGFVSPEAKDLIKRVCWISLRPKGAMHCSVNFGLTKTATCPRPREAHCPRGCRASPLDYQALQGQLESVRAEFWRQVSEERRAVSERSEQRNDSLRRLSGMKPRRASAALLILTFTTGRGVWVPLAHRVGVLVSFVHTAVALGIASYSVMSSLFLLNANTFDHMTFLRAVSI